MDPWTKTSVDVEGAGVDAEASCTGAKGAVAGADEVALVSGTCIAADLCPLGTLAKAVVDLPFFSSASS